VYLALNSSKNSLFGFASVLKRCVNGFQEPIPIYLIGNFDHWRIVQRH
jgi:hypothetical protein